MKNTSTVYECTTYFIYVKRWYDIYRVGILNSPSRPTHMPHQTAVSHQGIRGIASFACHHYNDVIMSVMASQITSLTIVYSTVYSSTGERKHQSSTWPANSPHKGPVTRKMFPFDDVIMIRVTDNSIITRIASEYHNGISSGCISIYLRLL